MKVLHLTQDDIVSLYHCGESHTWIIHAKWVPPRALGSVHQRECRKCKEQPNGTIADRLESVAALRLPDFMACTLLVFHHPSLFLSLSLSLSLSLYFRFYFYFILYFLPWFSFFLCLIRIIVIFIIVNHYYW